MKNFDYWKVSKFIPDCVCDTLVQSYSDWKQAIVHNNELVNSSRKLRESDVTWIKDPFWMTSFFKIMSDINEVSGLNFNIQRVENLQLTRYVAPAGHYDFHMDGNGYILRKEDGLTRRLSMSVLLNDPSEFEGGDFIFHVGAEPYSVDMGKGDIIVFPSYNLHKVSQVTKGTRYSLVVWALGNPIV